MTAIENRYVSLDLGFDECLDLLRVLGKSYGTLPRDLKLLAQEIQPFEVGDRVKGEAANFVWEGTIVHIRTDVLLAHVEIDLDTVDVTAKHKERGEILGKPIEEFIQYVKDTLEADNVMDDSNWSAYLFTLELATTKEKA